MNSNHLIFVTVILDYTLHQYVKQPIQEDVVHRVLVNSLPEHCSGDGSGDEMSTRQGNVAIIMKHALPITNILLEDFATALEMVTPTEVGMQSDMRVGTPAAIMYSFKLIINNFCIQ